jgi:hypothetical protein
VLVIIVSKLLTLTPTQGAELLVVKISSLVAQPEHFDKRVVRLAAGVRTDRHHFVILFGESDHQGVALVVPEKLRDNPAVIVLIREIYSLPQEAAKYRFAGTFTGTFEWHPGRVPSRVLILRELTDFRKFKIDD